MKIIRTVFFALLSGVLVLGSPSPSHSQAEDRAQRILKKRDKNEDGRIGPREWPRGPETFKETDTDGDGYLSLDELRARVGGRKKKASAPGGKMLDGQVSIDSIDQEAICALGRGPNCDIKLAVKDGMFETGLRPWFPDGLDCRDIDEQWAIDYTYKRDRENYHGGIDMPAPFGTPMIAMANGTVISKYGGRGSKRGREIILRHSPEDTGLSVWTYSQYAHFDEMPKVKVGERVKMGEVLGSTGNSGDPGTSRRGRKGERRPAIHFAIWFSESPNFAMKRIKVIPVNGHWMDPNAIYRKKPPFDSYSMKALPEAEKKVPIPVMLDDGTTIPAETKLVWPYTCNRE